MRSEPEARAEVFDALSLTRWSEEEPLHKAYDVLVGDWNVIADLIRSGKQLTPTDVVCHWLRDYLSWSESDLLRMFDKLDDGRYIRALSAADLRRDLKSVTAILELCKAWGIEEWEETSHR